MQGYLIIDGYNAISKIRELETKKDISLEVARLSFIQILQDFLAQKSIFEKIYLVFDSREKELGARRHSYGCVEVLFATADRDADSVIVDILRNAKSSDKIKVASDDNFVRNHAKVFGRDILSIKELQNIIMLKKKVDRRRIKEKHLESAKVRRINEELERYWGLK